MCFKSAVIICALNFVTVTQSIGLNGSQFIQLRLVIERHKNNIDNITNEDFINMGKSIGVHNTSGLINKEGLSNARKLEGLLVFLADKHKRTDDLKIKFLSPYEVRLYVEVFSDYDRKGNHNGLLSYTNVDEAVEALDLNKWNSDSERSFMSPKDRILEKHRVKRDKDKQFDALEFLHRMWSVKPEGRGIDKNQVLELMQLHSDHIKKGDPDNHIDPEAVTRFFKRLSIVKKDYSGQFAFNSIRKSYVELQELLVISAEYSSNMKKTGPVYSKYALKNVLCNFSNLDADKDGLLNKKEVSKMVSFYLPLRSLLMFKLKMIKSNYIDLYMEKDDTNNDEHLDIAEFFLWLFEKEIQL